MRRRCLGRDASDPLLSEDMMGKALSLLGRTMRQAGGRLLARGLVIGQGQDLHYHPLSPQEGGDGGRVDRNEGSYSRLKAINEILRSETPAPRIALDVGSHIGFFSLDLAMKGMLVHAVEIKAPRLRHQPRGYLNSLTPTTIGSPSRTVCSIV